MPHPFTDWLRRATTAVRQHNLHLLSETPGSRPAVRDRLQEVVREHYVSRDTIQQRLAQLGAPATAELLRDHLPKSSRARSGDLGEIITTEVAVHYLEYDVPVRRLRFKESREMALRGDDLVGFKRNTNGLLKFLKGESKSRQNLTDAVVESAAKALDKDRGRPSRLSLLFVAERLRDAEQVDLAIELEKALLDSFKQYVIEHMLCVVTGNDPTEALTKHINECRKRRARHLIGLRIGDHGEFIRTLYEELNA